MMDLQPAPGNAFSAYFILATDLRPGHRLRDHGRLRTVMAVDLVSVPFAKVVAHFEDDGGDLSIPPHQHVTVWR